MTFGDINREIKRAVAAGNTSLALHWAKVREEALKRKEKSE